MQIDYIRRDTPEEISENGGAYIQLVNKDTIGLKSSIAEAKSALYVVGQDSMIEGYFVGLMRSVFEGIKEDGHPRTVGDVTIFPVCGGTFDLDKGWDPLVNDVRIKARLLNGLTLDITDWTFRDVTEGRVSYSIDTVSDGEVAGQVSTNKDVELNGRNFPAKALLTVSWVCGEKSGTVDSAKFTANVARITIDKSAFSSLTSSDDGKEIVFTVKGCYNKATAKAVVEYVEPTPSVTNFHGEGDVANQVTRGTTVTFEGEALSDLDRSQTEVVVLEFTAGGASTRGTIPSEGITSVTDTKIVTSWPLSTEADVGTTITATLKFTGGRTATATATVIG